MKLHFLMYICVNKTKKRYIMKTFQIVLVDKVTKKIEKVENFKPSQDRSLKSRLLELQNGYCEDEKPSVFEKKVRSNGVYFNAMIAESNCDFIHLAVIK